MNEKIRIPETENYPVVEVVCVHCKAKFYGKIGPIKHGESYALHLYKDQIVGENPGKQITSWNLPPEQRYVGAILLTHHNTVRNGSQGHHQFTVNIGGQRVGVIRVSTSGQIFSAI